MAVDLAGGALPLAVLLDEGFQRAQQLAAVFLVAALDRAEDAVAVEPQRVVVLDREQQGEGAEVAPGRDLGLAAVGERRRLERAAGFVEGVAELLGRRRAAGRGADRAALFDQRPAGVGGEVDRVAIGGVDDRAEQLAPGAGVGGDDRRAGIGGKRPLERRLGRGGVVEVEDEDRGLARRSRTARAGGGAPRPRGGRRGRRRGRRRRGAARSRARPGAASARARRRRPPAGGSAARSRRGRRSRGRSRPRPAAAPPPGEITGWARARPATEGWVGTKGWPSPVWERASSPIALTASAESWRRKPRPASRSPRPSRIATVPPTAEAIVATISSRPRSSRTRRSSRRWTAIPRCRTSYCSLTRRAKAFSVIAMNGVE